MGVTDYGALLRVDGKFINMNERRFMVTPRTVPDYGYFKHAPREIEDNYMVYAGNNKLYGFWILVYKTTVDVVFDCQFIESFNCANNFNKLKDGLTIDLKECGEMYIETLEKDIRSEDRYKLTAYYWDNMPEKTGKKHIVEIIFGYGIDPNVITMNDNMDEMRVKFTPDEKNEILQWFIDASQPNHTS
jgi:hypothetical protein